MESALFRAAIRRRKRERAPAAVAAQPAGSEESQAGRMARAGV
jgi:hypothetical protein